MGSGWRRLSFVDSRAGPMHGRRRITASGGQTYLIEWRTPKAAWTTGLPGLAVVLDSFQAGL